jgi:hypothetical protein
VSGALRVLCAFEDRAFEDVALPMVRRIFDETGFEPPLIQGPLRSRGCRWKALQSILRDEGQQADLIVIGADTGPLTVAQKRSAMLGRIERIVDTRRVIFALPKPCAEGWLQADLQALKRGVEEELDEPITLPEDTGSYPTDEEQAKDRLAGILSRSDIQPLRHGLEFGPAIMRHVDPSAHSSLEELDRELRRWLSLHA